jgi:branched-chain amino acid transport system substrate-binding protein
MKVKVLSIVLAVAMVLGVIGCSTTGNTAKPAGSETITFGVLAPLTGTNAEYGKGFQVATQMAADEINAKGGVKGKQIKLIVMDSKGDPKESSDLTRQLIENKEVMAIIGDFTSSASMADAPIVDEAHITLLSPTASNPNYAAMSTYAFSIMGRQSDEGPFFATYILGKYMQAKKVGIIYINSDWGLSSFKAVIDQMKIDNIELVAEANYVAGETDFTSVITKVKAANPDTVLILDQGAVSQVVNQIRNSGWTDVKLATLGPGASQQLIDLTKGNSEGLITSTPFFFNESDAPAMAFKKTFVEKAGFEPTVHPVVAYDSLYLLVAAINQIDGPITREEINAKLTTTEYVGLAGPIKFNPAGDVTRKYVIGQVKDGKWFLAAGYDYSNSK